ncbi:MAG: hypothetical protein ACR5LG_10730 [Sodalis sp. (in: enterobacteria)]|uniref:hypothetical protein n=1 Tax=Sodalis sp. (in: enterobacteria) TaxID=1898979 RepID=UPI003F3448AB
MLVKTSVARKLLRQAWRRAEPVGRAAIYKIDAMQHFGAAVEACLFILPVAQGEPPRKIMMYSPACRLRILKPPLVSTTVSWCPMCSRTPVTAT